MSASSANDIVTWNKNQGGGVFGLQQTISNNTDYPKDVKAVDLDGDGDLDVISASSGDNKLAWQENKTRFYLDKYTSRRWFSYLTLTPA